MVYPPHSMRTQGHTYTPWSNRLPYGVSLNQRSHHTTSHLKNHHWLPISVRIKSQTHITACRPLYNLAPTIAMTDQSHTFLHHVLLSSHILFLAVLTSFQVSLWLFFPLPGMLFSQILACLSLTFCRSQLFCHHIKETFPEHPKQHSPLLFFFLFF